MFDRFDIPSNVLITGDRQSGKTTLIKYMMEYMDYSEIWTYPNRIGNTEVISNLSKFIYNITRKTIVSDCLMVVIDQSSEKDFKSIHKLLKLSKKFDIMVVIADQGSIRHNKKIMSYIDYECIFKSNGICNDTEIDDTFKSTYNILNQFEYIFLNRNNNMMTTHSCDTSF